METQEFKKRVKEYMEIHHMAETGDGILAAVSGGADSVCLLLVLEELAKELGIRLAAFHLNHGLRGAEADRDEAYVRAICEKYAIPLKVVREDVRAYAADCGMSEEEAGRALRYHHLTAAAEEFGCRKIATAHHSGDQVETVLMNLFRGSGLKGLGGIRPVRGMIIRPLLKMTRQEIETYLNKKKVVWCEDSTNRELNYERNKVRNVLIPWVEENINDRASDHILKTAEFAFQADTYFLAQAEMLLDECVIHADSPLHSLKIPTAVLDAQPQIMKTYLIRAMIGRVCESQKDISSRHVEAVCALTGPGGGTEANLPYGLKAVRGYETLEIKRIGKKPAFESAEEPSTGEKPFNQRWIVPQNGRLFMENMGFFVETCVFPRDKKTEIPKNQYTKWFDYDKIKSTLLIRTRESSDYYTLGDEKRKQLKRFFIDEKIPEAVRGEIPLLADGNHILWIIGYRISEHYKITNSTRTVLEVRLYKGEEND